MWVRGLNWITGRLPFTSMLISNEGSQKEFKHALLLPQCFLVQSFYNDSQIAMNNLNPHAQKSTWILHPCLNTNSWKHTSDKTNSQMYNDQHGKHNMILSVSFYVTLNVCTYTVAIVGMGYMYTGRWHTSVKISASKVTCAYIALREFFTKW